MSQTIPALDYDTFFIPVTSDVDVAQKKLQMTKTEFNKFMANEKKKEKFNMKLFEYSKDYYKDRLELIDLQQEIDSYEPRINSLKERKIEGNFSTVCILVSEMRNQITHLNVLRQNIQTNYNELHKKFMLKNNKFRCDAQIATIEHTLYLWGFDDQKRVKEERASKQHQTFLKLLGNLPDELLRLVQSYFTHETRSALLVHTYNPVKMFCALDKSGLLKTVGYINKKYAPVNKQFSPAWKVSQNLHSKLTRLYFNFYDREKGKYILSTCHLKIYLQTIFSLFHKYHQHQWCFDLYRAIIVCKK